MPCVLLPPVPLHPPYAGVDTLLGSTCPPGRQPSWPAHTLSTSSPLCLIRWSHFAITASSQHNLKPKCMQCNSNVQLCIQGRPAHGVALHACSLSFSTAGAAAWPGQRFCWGSCLGGCIALAADMGSRVQCSSLMRALAVAAWQRYVQLSRPKEGNQPEGQGARYRALQLSERGGVRRATGGRTSENTVHASDAADWLPVQTTHLRGSRGACRGRPGW